MTEGFMRRIQQAFGDRPVYPPACSVRRLEFPVLQVRRDYPRRLLIVDLGPPLTTERDIEPLEVGQIVTLNGGDTSGIIYEVGERWVAIAGEAAADIGEIDHTKPLARPAQNVWRGW